MKSGRRLPPPPTGGATIGVPGFAVTVLVEVIAALPAIATSVSAVIAVVDVIATRTPSACVGVALSDVASGPASAATAIATTGVAATEVVLVIAAVADQELPSPTGLAKRGRNGWPRPRRAT